jgi:hypothetical protein
MDESTASGDDRVDRISMDNVHVHVHIIEVNHSNTVEGKSNLFLTLVTPIPLKHAYIYCDVHVHVHHLQVTRINRTCTYIPANDLPYIHVYIEHRSRYLTIFGFHSVNLKLSGIALSRTCFEPHNTNAVMYVFFCLRLE